MAMGKTDKTLQLLKILSGLGGSPGGAAGLRNVTIKTAEPDDVTLVMEGTTEALDLDIFEVPVALYPLRPGDQLLAFPIVSVDSGRWALLAKLNGGLVLATMKGADSLQPDGMAVTYAADRLIIPPYFAVGNAAGTDGDLVAANIKSLKAGDRVSIAPTWDAADEKVKYVILNKY